MIKVYHKDSSNMSEVETESVQLAISTPNQIDPIIRGYVKPSYQQTMEARKKYKAGFRNFSDFFMSLLNDYDLYFNMFKEIERVLKSDGVFILNVGSPYFADPSILDFIFGSEMAALYPYVIAEQIVWVTDLKLRKDFLSQVITNNVKLFQHWFLYSKTDRWSQHSTQMPHLLTGTTKTFGQDKLQVHTAPEEILGVLIEKYSNEGDWILDALAGTGTLGLVGEKKRRNTILYEIEAGRIALMKERLKELNVEYVA